MIKVKAVCTRETYKNGDYRIHSWCLLEKNESIILSNYGSFSTKGENTFITEGKEYELELELISTHPSYGGSYKILAVPSMNALDLSKLTREESFEILMDCTSSERIANNILNAYENFIEIIMTEGKEAIDTNRIKGVGEVYLNAYAREITSKYKYYHLLQEFKDYKVDVTDCKAMCEFIGEVDRIKGMLDKKPYYVLIDVLGRSFTNADNLILELKQEFKESSQRCEYLMLSVLDINESNGSTRLNANDMYYYIQEEYGVPELLPLIVETVKSSHLIYYDEKSKDVAKMVTYEAECYIARFIKDKIENSSELNIDWTKYTEINEIKMTEEQSCLLEYFCKYNFIVLTGGAGMGKSQSVKGLINLLEDNSLSYCCLTPTGKSSKRLSEFTHRPSSTIHRKCLKDKEIWSDVVIVDETSMVDLPTFVMLLRCIENENARLVLVGDPAQLLPVGIGAIFNDIINSKVVPLIQLTKVFRYDSSGMLYVATNIRKGIPFFDSEDKLVKRTECGVKVGNNYQFIQSDDIFKDLIREYMKLISKGIKPQDILVLSPQNVGEIGTYEINNALQAEINPPIPNETTIERNVNQKQKITFRVGDRILNKKNDYKALPLDSYNLIQEKPDLLTDEDVPLTAIFNGQDGSIKQVEKDRVIVQFDEELIVLNKMKLSNVLLGLACSTHSSQGSQAKYVLNVVSPLHERMLTRNLLYVSDTRSELMQIDIGDMDSFEKALLIDGNLERDTFLKELLLDE